MKEGRNTYQKLEDNLIKASELHDFTYQVEDWDIVQEMLDNHKKKKKLPLWLLGGAFIVLVLSVGLTANRFNQMPWRIASSTIQAEAVGLSNQEMSHFSSSVEADSDKKTSNESSATNREIASSQSHRLSKTAAVSILDLSRSSKSSSTHTSTHLNYPQDPPLGSTYEDHLFLNSNDPTLIDKTPLKNETGNKNSIFSNETDESIKVATKLMANTSPVISALLSPLVIGDRNLDPLLPKVVITQESNSHNIFVLLPFVGGESSRSPNGSSSDLDFALGLQLSYTLNDKFGVFLRGQYIDDTYRAQKGDYTASKDFWKNAGAPDFTDARCQMIDVALGLSYYFSKINEPGLVLSTGLNSNFMLREQYTYNYTETGRSWDWQTGAGNNTLLSSIEMSLGYKFKVAKKRNIEIHSFYRMPTRGIGHGDVDLRSYGIRLGVSFYN